MWDSPGTEARGRRRLMGQLVEDAVLQPDSTEIHIGLRMRGESALQLGPVPVPMQVRTRLATFTALDTLLDAMPERMAIKELSQLGNADWQGEPMTSQAGEQRQEPVRPEELDGAATGAHAGTGIRHCRRTSNAVQCHSRHYTRLGTTRPSSRFVP